MISRNITVTALITSALFSINAAFAQAPAASAAAPVAPVAASKAAPAAKAEKVAVKPNKQFTAKTAKSKECSLKADEQKLKGKARQKFRAECKKAA